MDGRTARPTEQVYKETNWIETVSNLTGKLVRATLTTREGDLYFLLFRHKGSRLVSAVSHGVREDVAVCHRVPTSVLNELHNNGIMVMRSGGWDWYWGRE